MPGNFDDLIPEQDPTERYSNRFADLVPDKPKRGIGEDTRLQAVGGVRDAVQSMFDLANRAGEALERHLPIGTITIGSDGISHTPGVTPISDLPEVAEPETVAGGLTRGISQFATGLVPGMQVARIARVAAGTQRLATAMGASERLARSLGLFGSSEVAAQIADQVAFDPHGQRLSNLVEDVPELANPVTAYLASDPEDSESDARLKMALEGAGIGAILPAVVASARGLRSTLRRKFPSKPASDAGEEVAETAGEAQGRAADEIEPSIDVDPEIRPDQFDEASLRQRAGNINLDNLGTTDDVKRAITATADEFAGQIDEARRGVMAEAQTQKLADDLGMTPEQLMRRRRGEALNAEQALAARQLLTDSGEDLVARARTASGGSDADVLAFTRALERHAGIQAQVAGMTAEAGRALRQFRITAAATNDRAIKETLENFGGRDTVEELARKLTKIDTPGGRAGFVRDATHARTSDKLLEAWINALLSGPQTHAVNVLSNTLVAAWTIPEHLIAAGIGAVRRGKDRVRFGEVTARTFGAVQGVRDGLKAAAKTFLSEEPSDLLTKIESNRYRAVPSLVLNKGKPKRHLAGIPIPFSGQIELGGKQIRIPGRALQASDEFFKAVGFRMELNARALRDGLAKNLKGKELAEHVAGIVRKPPEDLTLAAIDAARYQTFTRPLGTLGRSVQRIAAEHPGFRLIMPFIRTPANIAKFAVERSPFAVMMREVRDNLRVGGATRDIQLARITMGTGIGAVVAQLAAEGSITGGGPTDRTSRAALRMTGWQPYSFKVGDQYIAYSRLEPLGMIFGISADFAEISGELDEAQADDIAGRVVGSIAQNITSKTFLRGLSEAIRALDDPDRYGERWIQSYAGTLIPTVAAQVARTEDPVLRDTQTIVDRLKSRLPGFSTSLPARRNLWGEPIVLGGGLGPDIISPIYTSHDRRDRTSEEFARLNVRVGMPQRRISGPNKESVELTPEQYWQYVETAGRMAKTILDRVVTDPGYAELPDDTRREMFERIIRRTRQAARVQLLRDLARSQASERTADSELSPEDLASPIPNSLIREGRRIIDDAMRAQETG